MTKPLTAREIEIATLFLEGAQMKNIARDLKITRGTVGRYMFNVREKLGVGGKNSALMVAAIQQALKPNEPELCPLHTTI